MSFSIFLAFIAVTYLRPAEALAPDLEMYRITFWLSIVSLVASVASLLLSRSIGTAQQAQAKRDSLFLIALLCVAVFASLATKGYFGEGLSALSIFSPSAVTFLLTVINVNSMKRLKISCLTIAFCKVVLAIASIASYHTGFMADQLMMAQVNESAAIDADAEVSDIPAQDTSGKYLWRIRSLGFLNDPNDFGQAMIMALPLLLGGYIAKKRMRNILLVGIPALILGYAIYLTHSRGALVGAAALFFFAIKRKFGARNTLLLIALSIVISSVAPGLMGGREFSSDDESAGDRIDAWGEGLSMFAAHPIFGIGYRNFIDNYFITAHNSWVLCFSELGLAGYFCWLGILVIAFKSLNQVLARAAIGSEEAKWAGILRISLLGFLTCAFFLSRTYIPNLYLLLALCICAAQCANIQLAAANAPPRADIKWINSTAIISITSIIGIYLIVRLHNSGLI